MKNPEVEKLLHEANYLLSAAKKEIERPDEDAVTYLICQSAKRTISNLLCSYLKMQNVEPDDSLNLPRLLEQCKGIDPSFSTVKLEELDRCDKSGSHDTSVYCLGYGHVKECLQVADDTKHIVYERLGMHH